LIAPEISIGGNYSYDKKGQFYTTTKIYGYIKYKDVKENYLFWLGLLNSRLFWFYIRSTGYILRGGYFTFKTNYIEPFPVPERIDESIYFRIHRKVNKILNDSKYNEGKTISKLEREIDFLLYKLYDLNSEYIAHIERKASIDRC
jgi:hypothetical protein